MAREIPEAVRAVAGLAATVLDEARKLPETLPGLPVRVLGMAMQVSMKLQQHYAGLVARGDELLTGLHGEHEPGLATFDDDDEPAEAPGFRDSAFDRAEESTIAVEEQLDVAGAEAADSVADADRDLSQQVEASAEVLEELAIDEMVEDRPVTEDADAVENALLESDRAAQEPSGSATEVDVLTPDGEVATTEATVTDEAIAAPETAASGGGDGRPQAADLGGSADRRLGPPATAPVEGYDEFSIAQLRGRLRGYAPPTVQKLVEYEESTRAREPYLRMLRNRLEKLATQ